MVWARYSQQGLTVTSAAGGIQANLLGNFETEYGANLIGATAIRIRGVIAGSPATLTDVSNLRVGVRVSNDADTTAGNGPYDSPYADWMLWEPFLHGGAASMQWGDPHQTRVIDVRSMRKLEEINEQLTIWEQVSDSDGSWTVSCELSILLKLP